ncbi:hypothetical protein B4114_0705 [Geobacillus stearothermophilus]|uniref:Uncharacterized protein n=1 Tax=Geobacillus stearothermophilus TaxID=1422 RepID=A0A150NBA6_GEOSE|nr:hypothetical protein B4114_0705 [Geobacillus stearothermophilus]
MRFFRLLGSAAGEPAPVRTFTQTLSYANHMMEYRFLTQETREE